MTDRNCLSYWWPKLVAANIPTPKTEIVDAGENWSHLMGFLDDPKQHPGEWAKAKAVMEPLAENIRQAAARIGPAPYFLRTGQGSGKHRFKDCCDLRDMDALESHILALVEWSEMVDMMGLPWRFWVVRERLPVKPIAILPGYGGMPLVREMRCFVEGGKILCHHAYWPRDAIRDGLDRSATLQDPWDDEALDVEREREADRLYAASLMDMGAEHEALRIAKDVAKAFADDGYWSVDVLETERGFYVTDMAVGERSFHWPDCPNKKVAT
jgi:hypothetical protein